MASKRTPFQIRRVKQTEYVAGFPGRDFITSSFPDWTARERIAVECFTAMLRHTAADFRDLAHDAFLAADALIAAAKDATDGE